MTYKSDVLKKSSYVLITPARNEEAYIEKTIQSVISQTVLPVKWIIVSDGSTDATDNIVKKYLPDNKWIELIRMNEHRDRSFAAKANCFNAGYQLLENIDYDIIGNLDADISFDNNYIEFLLNKFAEIHDLGVGGTPFIEDNYSSVTDSFEGEKHVAGGCQLFRRKCFEDIGGYIPIKDGIDWVAVTTARMKGWKTRAFKEKYFFHYRKLGTGESNTVAAIFKYGRKDYNLGGHPLWIFLRILYRTKKKPYILGGFVLLSGYVWAFLKRERFISVELMRFHRKEQMQKLKVILKSVFRFKKIDKFNLDS
jgi:glycosyltransferase involved in cell wall biosynthesis